VRLPGWLKRLLRIGPRPIRGEIVIRPLEAAPEVRKTRIFWEALRGIVWEVESVTHWGAGLPAKTPWSATYPPIWINRSSPMPIVRAATGRPD
jgi:hypothetical protein